MGLLAQLLDLRKSHNVKQTEVRSAINRLVKENADIASAVQSLQKGIKEPDQALVQVISRNPAAHAALVEALLQRRTK